MLALLFLPFRLMMELALLPLRLMVSLVRSGWVLAIGVVMGLASLVAGLVKGLLPLILIGVGLTMIAGAYKSVRDRRDGVEKVPVEEMDTFRSFYANGHVE